LFYFRKPLPLNEEKGMMSRDPDSQVSLMLCESILHLLVEERVITKERALEAINGIVELLQESDEIGQCRSTRCSAVPLIEAIARTFTLKGPDERREQGERQCGSP
jgi:hypothetical protein